MAKPVIHVEVNQLKLIAGLLGIFFGGFGVHKFILGYNAQGVIMLLISLLTCGFGGAVMVIIGLIEGIIYLVTSDEDFQKKYVDGNCGWF